ncbi:rhomboid-like protein [Streptomyces sp. cg2]|uniref:rhomboid-like protein n=1 Tax=Streptomyces sp. cg2 TaxID=3238799 RepID=UPI0034E2FC9D
MASAVEAAGGAPASEGVGEGASVLLPGVPRQRGGAAAAAAPVAAAEPVEPPASVAPAGRRAAGPRLRRLLPTPTGTPFTFCYALLLVGTSLYAEHGDPSVVSALLQGSSTDVVHLTQAPLPVLIASALWSAGGLASGFAVAFLFVLTALERRIGGVRTATVFFGGHALATLATEVPVAFSVAAGELPESSLHRLDYGISFGVMTCIGALAGLLPAWGRWPLLAVGGFQALSGLLDYVDPMTDWGHLLSLALGVAAWPLLHYWWRQRTGPAPLPGDLGHPALRAARVP